MITHICTIRAIQLSMYINHMVNEFSDTGWISLCIYLPLNGLQLSRTLNESINIWLAMRKKGKNLYTWMWWSVVNMSYTRKEGKIKIVNNLKKFDWFIMRESPMHRITEMPWVVLPIKTMLTRKKSFWREDKHCKIYGQGNPVRVRKDWWL